MEKVTKWEDISFLLASTYRKRVLEKLNNPTTPSKLSKEIGINKTHISRTLSDLEERNLIVCLTPKAVKGKLYKISDYGKEILKETSKI